MDGSLHDTSTATAPDDSVYLAGPVNHQTDPHQQVLSNARNGMSGALELLAQSATAALRTQTGGLRSDDATASAVLDHRLDYGSAVLHHEARRENPHLSATVSQRRSVTGWRNDLGGDHSGGAEAVLGALADPQLNLRLEAAASVGTQHADHYHQQSDDQRLAGREITINSMVSPFLIKHEIDGDMGMQSHHQGSHLGDRQAPLSMTAHDHSLLQSLGGLQAGVGGSAGGLHSHHQSIQSSHLLGSQLQQLQHSQRLLHAHDLAAAAAAGGDLRHMHYGGGMPSSIGSTGCLSAQKAVAFLAGPRERIHVLGNPVEHCPRCQQEGMGATPWRPHRHIGELKIRYICERHFDDLESNHHFDIPLCPICNQVLYLYDFNNMLGVSNARRLHKFVLKCANRHVLPLLDLFCQTKKGGERCNANFKLQWCYGTMVKRCEAQKNRDHDLWWVRYKNEWKQRRTIIRYKKDFLSHLTDAQRSLLLGLGLEGEPPPDPKSALGPTFDALVSTAGASPSGPKIKKRPLERGLAHLGGLDPYDLNPVKRVFRVPDYGGISSDYGPSLHQGLLSSGYQRSDGLGDTLGRRMSKDSADVADSLRHMMGAVVVPTRPNDDPQCMHYVQPQQSQHQQQQQSQGLRGDGGFASQSSTFTDSGAFLGIPPHLIVTGTPTPPLTAVNGVLPVAISVVGEVLSSDINR